MTSDESRTRVTQSETHVALTRDELDQIKTDLEALNDVFVDPEDVEQRRSRIIEKIEAEL